jgi:multisubunit Na+/H+ antiporter MnhC subunit
MIEYLLCVILLLIGVYCVAVKKNLIKIIIGLVIMEYSMNLLLVIVGYRKGGIDPIMDPAAANAVYVDPLAQAFALAMIAVGLATTITMSAIAIRIYDRYGTFDITKIRNLKG